MDGVVILIYRSQGIYYTACISGYAPKQAKDRKFYAESYSVHPMSSVARKE